MTRIEVAPAGARRFRVTIRAERAGDDSTRSEHVVTVPAGYVARLDADGVALSEIVRGSVRFLLERRPVEAIPRTFALSDLAARFPTYEGELAARLAPLAAGARRRLSA